VAVNVSCVGISKSFPGAAAAPAQPSDNAAATNAGPMAAVTAAVQCRSALAHAPLDLQPIRHWAAAGPSAAMDIFG